MRSVLFVGAIATLAACAGKHHDLSTGTDTAIFVPVVEELGVEIFVDEIDGVATSFAAADTVSIDPGTHEILVRLEYQPASGSSVVAGGIGNLLLRAATNRTFTSPMTIEVESGNVYRLTAAAESDSRLHVIVHDETRGEEVHRYSFALEDGEFQRLF
jgi:hypothetical protein